MHRWRKIVLLAGISLVVAGCSKGRTEFKEGRKALALHDYDVTFEYYQKALEIDPAFAQRVWREATRRRFCQATRTAVHGDGAPWIWKIAEDQFPLAIQIVDRFRAKQHLSDLGKALYGPTTPRASQWAERRKRELDTGKFRVLLAAIRRQVSRSEDARRCLHYFDGFPGITRLS